MLLILLKKVLGSLSYILQYMCTGQYTDLPIEDDDLPDPDVKHLLQLVGLIECNSNDHDVLY